ncbi:MAG: sodium-translocating pyrophosphatase [Spirochaetes bacterium]|nr:sodium-translocating pyrophosphatase [Spirochaetota bacterium]
MKFFRNLLVRLSVLALTVVPAFAGEADLILPAKDKRTALFNFFGLQIGGETILTLGIVICLLGGIFGIWQWMSLKKLPVHKSMRDVSSLIFSTCWTYLKTQGRLLAILWLLIGATMVFYFSFLKGMHIGETSLILMWSLIGMGGSFLVALFGITINNIANSRMAFASLRGKPTLLHSIPTRSGMSIGVLLISVELIMMIVVLKFVDPKLAGVCFIGFAIGESLGASVLRICGGIFTKIADVGSDMMKIVFKIKEDDARNPGVIADCAGDNAGDSVGPTADGFETYGVTGVALISFILLAVVPEHQWSIIVWIFTMRIMMVVLSILAWVINSGLIKVLFKPKGKAYNFEHPLTTLVWLTSLICIGATYAVSYTMLGNMFPNAPTLWWKLATIISCGTIAAAIIPELTKAFTSTNSGHVKEIVDATKEGGTGLTILSGIVSGNFSAVWMGFTLLALMLVAYLSSQAGLDTIMTYPSVFAFGLVAFGMLGMGPVTIAVDSYGPVTDNAQSVYELSTIENIKGIEKEVERDFGFKPDFETGKMYLEENDGCGNTFKATAKPMLIGTAVVGATTMIFSMILMLQKTFKEGAIMDKGVPAMNGVTEKISQGWQTLSALSIIDPWVILGMLAGGAVIYWFSGASMQAVTVGAYRAVEYIKKNIKLDGSQKASAKDSNEVVRICTVFAQKGMINIFVVIFSFALGFAFINPVFFTAYLISIALFGLFAAIYMANAGGAWDNAKKVVETGATRQKGTALHDSVVVGDLVGDPFKDTSSVALNPIIKFTTLFGLLAVEIAVSKNFWNSGWSIYVAAAFIAVGLIFILRSFYGMRISQKD